MRSSGVLTALVMSVFIATLNPCANGGPPPGPDVLTENSAASWGASADGASASVSNDATRVRIGAASLRFDTTGGFDTWLWAPSAKNANWDLLASGGPAFWVYASNPNGAFQNASPWIRLYSSAGNYLQYQAAWDVLNDAMGQWLYVRIPLNGDATWDRTLAGSPNLSAVRWIEIHADTWGAGFTLWLDGMSFDVPLSAPGGLMAIAGNHRVSLSWQPFVDPTSTFDHYNVYRSTAPFSDVTGLTPIASQSGINSTSYVDASALNGVHYHYAVTAVLTGGAETRQVDSVGPRTPRDETDLQIVTISRTPRYPRYDPIYTYYSITEPSGFGPYSFSAATGLGSGQTGATQRFPNVGDTVTYTSTVRNRGTNTWSGTLGGTWSVDGTAIASPSQAVTLAPGDVTSFALNRTWDGASHEIRFAINLADARSGNNALAVDTKSVAFLSYVDQTYAEDFREDTANYAGAISDDMFDWLNAHMARYNQMFVDAACGKRVHFDVLAMLADSTADPAVNRIEFAIFPFRYRAGEGSLRLSGYYSPADDLDFGLLHEMGHQLGLIDIYRLDLPPELNQVSNTGYTAPADLMHGCSPFISEHSANGMNHWLNTAHGYYGQYLYGMPAQVRMRFFAFDGAPLSGATVKVYQMAERPGLGQILTNQVKAQGVTDAAGEYVLPNVPINPALVPTTHAGDTLYPNPFGYVAVVGTNGLLLLAVEKDGFVDYAWLDIIEVNNAYYAGQTASATFERRLALGGQIQYYPPADMAELNAASWASWSQDGVITLADDTTRTRVGAASVRIDTTGGFDNYVRYPGEQLAIWDLSGVQSIRFWMYAINPNLGFQSGSPWVRLGNADGFYEWRSATDELNLARDQWREFIVPIAGSSAWPRTIFGSPELGNINYIELHADTWDAGFTLWMDGVRVVPQPCAGDANGDRAVDNADLQAVLDAWASSSGDPNYDAAADFNRDGAIENDDLQILLDYWAQSCP